MKIFKQEFEDLFPIGGAKGKNGRVVQAGNVFSLTLPGQAIGVDVKVMEVKDFSFVLQTTNRHLLEGTATHGLFQDSTGEVWMFQEGLGNDKEGPIRQLLNNGLGPFMWRKMADKMKNRLEPPANSKINPLGNRLY
jgi:hypothetical protein